ncbi:hypothetical protein QIX46_19630 [Lysinibacillus boronitolerans]|nr:hypothetical protein QIX46_19630 [Lysinibacillus boronitolerans]
MDNRTEVHDALASWILYVTNKKGKATSDEIAALPKVAEVFFGYYSPLFSSSVKKEDTVSKK